jgi:hypothetical protein
MALGLSPDQIIDKKDTGAETTRRYLYQAAYGALQSILMNDDESEIQEIFYEQQEDILLKLFDGSFIGIQVKTQEDSKGGFKFGDEPILKAIARFILLEQQFPEKFKRYIICTNCGFARTLDASDLDHCLNLIHQANNDIESCYKVTNFAKYIKKLLTLSEITDEKLVIDVLTKTILTKWAGLRDYKKALISEIAELLNAEHQPHGAIKRTAEMLTDIALHAGEFPDNQTQRAYHQWINDPAKAMTDYIISQKKIDRQRVTDVINKCFNPTGLLKGVMPVSIQALPLCTDILTQKLDAGKLTTLDIQTIRDCDNSALTLLYEWYNAFGPNEANARYDHLRIIMQRECSDAFNIAYNDQQPFGQAMLGLVRGRIRERQPEVIRRYADCSHEHLEGIAGILTDSCIVWWSKQFTLREAVNNGPV